MTYSEGGFETEIDEIENESRLQEGVAAKTQRSLHIELLKSRD
jgi:hypothetical protein